MRRALPFYIMFLIFSHFLYSYICCSDDEHSARSFLALIMFVGYAITPASSTDISKGDNATTDLISLLVDHATIKGDSNVSDIVSVPQQTTSKVMNAIGATDFLNGTLAMLQSDETMFKAGALEILADRIPKAAETVRREQQKTATSIFDCIRDVPTVSRCTSHLSTQCFESDWLLHLSWRGVSVGIYRHFGHQNHQNTCVIANCHSCVTVLCSLSDLGLYLTSEILQRVYISPPRRGRVATWRKFQWMMQFLPYGAWYRRFLLSTVLQKSGTLSNSTVTLSGSMTGLMKAIAKKIPCNMLLPILCDVWKNLRRRNMVMDSSRFSPFSNAVFE